MSTCQCGASWQGARTSHCGGCHETFTTVANFDRHRSSRGEFGACLAPTDRGLEVASRAGYTAWAQPNEHYAWEGK